MPWDGAFGESKYIETGNAKLNEIKNKGRFVHEATVDGYTHEIVDRGNYISDDYYFPQRVTGKKPHIHYEIRAYGNKVDVLIDGKSIIEDKGGERNVMSKCLDRNILDRESSRQVQEGKKLHELGKKFESDKGKLEEEIEKVENSSISNEDKKEIIRELERAVEKLQEQYEREVTEEEQRVKEELEENIDSMREVADEIEKQKEELESIDMEAAESGTLDAINAAEIQKRKFENLRQRYEEKLKELIEEAEHQEEKIRS